MFKKLTSGRWIQTVLFTFTYCIAILFFCVMTVKKIITTETLMAIWAGFAAIVALVTSWYFERKDRGNEK